MDEEVIEVFFVKFLLSCFSEGCDDGEIVPSIHFLYICSKIIDCRHEDRSILAITF